MIVAHSPGLRLRNVLVGLAWVLGAVSTAAQSIAVSTLAGSSPAIASGNVDATGTAARFSAPVSVAVDAAGNIYVADAANHKIRKITSGGVVTTLAGSGTAGNANGTGAAASFNFPQGVASDGTNVYVADTYNHAIRQIVISTGVVTTLAGTSGSSGTAVGAPGTGRLNNPLGVAVAGSDLYVADTSNHGIRKVVISTGVISNFVGTLGTPGSTDGTGVAATFKGPGAIAAEGTTNLYVADTQNNIIRKIMIGTGAVTTLAGTASVNGGSTDSTGAAASFKSPGGLVVSGANLFVADAGNSTIRQVVISSQVVTTITGTAGLTGAADAIGTAARFNSPNGIGVSTGGTLYIADTNSHTIRSAGAAVAPTVSNPANVTVTVGADPTFTVTVTGNPTATIQWERQAANTTGFAAITASSTFSNVNTATLTVSNVTVAMNGDQFRASVVNGVGGAVVSATPATLTVQQAPAITSAAAANFSVNTVGSFPVVATGSPAPTFGVTAGTFPPWASLNSTTGVISGTPTNTVGSPFSFTIRASNGVNPFSDQAFILNVNAPAPGNLNNISARLLVPVAGLTAHFRVEGTSTKQILIRGIGPALAAFGIPGSLADISMELMSGSGAVVASNDDWGASSNAAQVASAAASVGAFALPSGSRDAAILATVSAGFYSVRLKGVGATTGQALIEIYEADQLSRTAGLTYLAVRGPVGSGAGQLICGYTLGSGALAPIMIRVAGPSLLETGSLSNPTVTIQNPSGATIASNDDWGGSAAIAAVAGNFGAIPFGPTSFDSGIGPTIASGSYTAQVSGVGGTTGVALFEVFDASTPSSLRAPYLYSVPASQSVIAGQTASFSVIAGGTGTLSYQWRRNATPISGATSATYSFTAASGDAGAYDALISNTVGAITSVAGSLSVTLPAPPVITSATGSGSIVAGTNALFSVAATGTAPLTYQWRKDTLPISAATNSSLPLNNATVGDSGVYDVVVSNAGGSVTSVSLPLTVTPSGAPTITTQPVGGTLSIGNVASFRVTATGSPTLLYQWRKNSSPIGGATSSVYILGAVTAASAGSYDVVVTNIAGSLPSDAAALMINPPVAFNSQPLSVSTFVGMDVTFSASAIGFPGTPTYQWRKDTFAIVGATSSSLTLPAAQPADAGSYDVIATASAGSATSNSATLSITNSAPQITAQPVGATLAVGGNLALSASVIGSAPRFYQWKRDGIAITGATSASFALVNAQTFDGGLYTVVVTNALGSDTSTGARLNVVPRVVAYSARLQIDPNGAVAVFTIEGTLPKKVLLRAVGPGLASFGFAGLPDPQLELFNSAGTLLAINNDWASSADAPAITATTAAVGAFALTIGSRDSAVLATLAPGTYTVRAKPASGAGGTGYLELYDADLATGPMSTLPYVAVRGRMGAGGGVVIGGLGSNGRGQRSYLVRAIGPSLGLPGAHANPAMLIVRDGTLVGSNDDWDSNPTDASGTTTATARVATFPLPAGARDAALVLTGNLHAGACTVQVGGSDALGGTVLLELHDLDAVRPTTFAPTIVSAPVSTSAVTGEPATLRVLAQGTAPLSYQWRKDGIPLGGATAATLALASVQGAQGGSYTVLVSNSLGAATSLSAMLSVQSGGSGSAATQAVVGGGYTAGGTATITNTLTFASAATGLGWKVNLPLGWSFVSDAGMLGDVRPVVGTVGALEWAWSAPPVSPVTLSYTVRIPPGVAGDQFIASSGIVRIDGSLSQPTATPSPLLVAQITTHTADTNADFRISLVELTRVIELFNTRILTMRTGRYLIQDGTEDGFGLDTITPSAAPATLARFHSADSNRNATISLFELTRVIELFNARAGTARTGAYHAFSGSEDGFEPGP